MRNIELTGTLRLTDDLVGRLRSRGLLSISGECTEDFILFIQECIARDDNRCSILVEKMDSEVSLPSVEVKTEVSKNDSEIKDTTGKVEETATKHKVDALSGSLSSLVNESDFATLREGLSTLYKGG